MEEITLLNAYNFEINEKLSDLKTNLSKEMGHTWVSGHKEETGDYISVVNKTTGSVIRIFENNKNMYTFDIINRKGKARNEFNSEQDQFIGILNKIGAKNISSSEDMY